MVCGIYFDIWPAMALAVPAAFLLVRLFIIQHDCGHGSFFKSRRANDLVGKAIGVLTLTPYVYWRNEHATHHATSGNLDKRGVGDISTLTVREYLARSAWGRFLYRLYRNPLVLFGIGPTWQFMIRHRIPTGNPLRKWREWGSILGTNATIGGILVIVALSIGLGPFLLAYLPVMACAASIGVWLFYVQHQFEDAYWERAPAWDFHAAAMQGCSFYDLPRVLHWLTGHIGLHHIHHLASRIPNYRLRECFEQTPLMRQAKRLTLWGSIKCARLTLWDEELRRLVPFGAVRRDR